MHGVAGAGAASWRGPSLGLGRGVLDWQRPYVAGVVNLTPDSFSDGGRLPSLEAALGHARGLVEAGADLIDVGGESTRPGAAAIGADEEIARVIPLLRALADLPVPVSIDTTKAPVAAAALDAGADLVNDISGGLFDPEILAVTASAGAGYVLGHVRGRDLVEVHASAPASFDDVARELGDRLLALPAELRARTVVDPCLGFGKGTAANLELLGRAGELSLRLGAPVLVGPSRKRFLGEVTGQGVGDRDAATVGACLAAVAAGAHIVRVHDVAGVVAALRVFTAVRTGASA